LHWKSASAAAPSTAGRRRAMPLRLAVPLPLRRRRRALLGVAAFAAAAALGLARRDAAWVPGTGSNSAAGWEAGGEEAALAARPSGQHGSAVALSGAARAPVGVGTLAGCAGALAAALVALLAAAPSACADWGVRNVGSVKPPPPDPNPKIRALQAKSWAMEPFTRQRMYLKAMAQRMEFGLLNQRYFVHWAPDSYKYDVLDQKNFEEATKLGKLLLDSDLSEPTSESVVFIYAKPEDQQWVSDNLGVVDFLEIPAELQKAIEQIKATPFGE